MPSDAPGRVTARATSTSTRTISAGMRTVATRSIAETPLATTSTASPSMMAWQTAGKAEDVKSLQNAPGTGEDRPPPIAATA